MTMTRKHFELVAEAIRVERPAPSANQQPPHALAWDRAVNETLNNVADNLAAQFKMINPRFDKARFMEATRT